uniref:G-protein coupled receptors family 1 profile domain-containing protein n=1 Tax=Erpetoichthys calabaricus TaxID=27687 RepID=A0A8C4T3P6_ERPCA
MDSLWFFFITAFYNIGICAILFMVGTTGNGLVIWITGFKMKKSINSIWFLNLALADFIFTTFLIFDIINIFMYYEWPFGTFFCHLNALVMYTTMFSSIFLLSVISVDRCLLVEAPVWMHHHRIPRNTSIVCLLVWSLALVVSLPYAVFMKNFTFNNNTYLNVYWTNVFNFAHFLGGFLIPLISITSSYTVITCHQNAIKQKASKMVTIFVAITVIFFLCWFPYHFMKILEFFQPENEITEKYVTYLYPFVGNIIYINSSINPMLYAFLSPSFWRTCKKSCSGLSSKTMSLSEGLSA